MEGDEIVVGLSRENYKTTTEIDNFFIDSIRQIVKSILLVCGYTVGQ